MTIRVQFLGMAMLSLVCLSSAADAQDVLPELQPVTLQLKWTHQFQFAGYYMAKHKGYYYRAGLDVTLLPGGPEMDVTERVLSGQADFGVGTSSLLLDYAEGKPVVALGVIYQHSPQVLIMREDKPSDTVQSLDGKTIMMEPNSADLLVMLSRNGLSSDRVTFVAHSGNAEDLFENKADAISAYLTDEPYTLDRMGLDYFILSPRSEGIDFYGDNLFTRTDMLKEQGDVVRAFYQASMRGWRDALQNPEAAVDLIVANYPTRKSREHLLYEARITRDLMTQLVTPGYMLPGRWKHIAETYMEVGMLEEMPDLKGFIYQSDPPALPEWFGRAAIGGLSILILLGFLSMYFKALNMRLRKEIVRRRKMEVRLRLVNQDLQRAKSLAVEANRKKTRFIANVSHDLRAPISSIIGLANIFRHHSERLDLPEDFRRFLGQLDSSGEFLMLLLNNLLDLSSFEMDAARVHLEPVQLRECCDTILNLLQSLATERGVEVQMKQTLPEEPVEVDKTRLSQIIMNLIHNAIKFSPEKGTVFVEVAIQSDVLRMEVRDQGPGIPEEERSRIFNMFDQGGAGLSEKSGSGLGLSIIQRNTRLLRGTIRVDAAPSGGARFIVEIPLNVPKSADSSAKLDDSQKNGLN